MARFNGRTYEEIYGEERESEANDYLQALTAGGRMPSLKAKDILYVLMSEYILDLILIENLNPKLKLYDNAVKFAELITNYQYKYINRRINRIEFVEKKVDVKLKGTGVQLGYISNDPYLRLTEINRIPDFNLAKPTYAWLVNDIGQEELAIFTSSEKYNKSSYREFCYAKEDPELKNEIDKLSIKFSNEAGYQISRQYLTSVIKRLNRELIILPVDFIRKHTQESYEYIEPLRYKFSVVKGRKEFESLIYNSIENNLNGRYKYRFVEKLSGIYLTIGNKLNYTDLHGNLIRKQSIADFNINYNAAIIKRETIVDNRSIPQLMGYIYKDVDSVGTDMLPVPSIEVDFYFPDITLLGRDVEMYNGTPVDTARGDGSTAFYEIGNEIYGQPIVAKPRDPNEKYVTVKYINSDGEILKENIIRDIDIGSIYTPEVIPIITDKDGKEWVISNNQIPNVKVTEDNSLNIVEIRYVKKISKVRISFINKQGTELAPPTITNMQVGETFDMESVSKFIDPSGVQWSLYQSNPMRLTISEMENANNLILVYDVVKVDVFISYKNRLGIDLKPQEKITCAANLDYSANPEQQIMDNSGLVWELGKDSQTTINVSETDLNIIEVYYDEKKVRVTTSYVDEEGQKIKDDNVEFIQAGKLYFPRTDPEYVDMQGKHWRISTNERQQIKVSLNEADNICFVTYEKVMSTIAISLVNSQGQKIKEDIIEQAQIGTTYTSGLISEIEDATGAYWTCIDNEKSLLVTPSELQNRLSFTYAPLMTVATFVYVDDEGNELIPNKEKQVQAGSFVSAEILSTLTSKDQRVWTFSLSNQREFKTSKYKEENIFHINYDKKLTNVTISFRNVSGMKLKDDAIVEAQIGSEYKANAYEKITADNGERWMLYRSDPENMFVRENSRFILIYDEIRARVFVKCINILNDTPIIDDQMILTKLGGVFVPNVQLVLYDKENLRWKYVGEPAMSITAQEEDQKNIITLRYEPALAQVTLKYENNFGQMVHKDVVKDEQIGSAIGIKDYDKIIDESGRGWKFVSCSKNNIIVDENPNNNIVLSSYEPLMVDVKTRYIDNEGNELIESKTNQVQVGDIFFAEPLPRVVDKEGKTWEYSNIKVEPYTVLDEDNNKVNIKYVPLMSAVSIYYIDSEQNRIKEDKIIELQVGTIFQDEVIKRLVDAQGRFWQFKKASRDVIRVFEDKSQNEIVYNYDKELADVIVKYVTNKGDILQSSKQMKVQLGTSVVLEPPLELIDGKKMGWIVSDTNNLTIEISQDPEKNNFEVVYDEHMVNVLDKYVDFETGEELIEPKQSKVQVGSSYTPSPEDKFEDESGRAWEIYDPEANSIFISKPKFETIIISSDESKNVTTTKYQKRLAQVSIKYVDGLGNQIKSPEIKMLQIGAKFEEEVPIKIIDSYGNRWAYNPNSNTDLVVTDDPSQNEVVLSYEEAKGTVTFIYLDSSNNEIQPKTTQLVQIGSHFVPQCEMILTDKNSSKWEYQERDKESIEVSDEDENNIFTLTYIPLKAEVLLNYIDLWDNPIKEPFVVGAQLGSKFTPTIPNDYTNEDGLLYRLKKIEPNEIEVIETPIGAKKTPNEFTITFEPINSDIIIQYKDTNGNIIRDEEKVHLQVGTRYKPEPVQYIKDKRGNEWELINAPEDEVTVYENSNENVLVYHYDVAKADVVTRFVTIDGFTVKEEQRISMQVGTDYVPNPDKEVISKDNRKWTIVDVKPLNMKIGSLNNIVTATYQEAQARVTLKFVDESGNILKAEEKINAQIGSKYSPKLNNKVLYNANEIWRLKKTEPYEIIVSENSAENEVQLIYSNEQVVEEEVKEDEIVNPFANTLNENEKEEVYQGEGSLSDAIFAGANNGESISEGESGNTENESEDVGPSAPSYEFSSPNLKKLTNTMTLTVNEMKAIDMLNTLDNEILEEIKNSYNAYSAGSASYDYSKAEALIVQEKELIKQSLANLIAQDKTGNKLLKIFEQITFGEGDDKIVGKTQQKKAIAITDYFVNNKIEDIEKISYICEKGKNLEKLKNVVKKISTKGFKEIDKAIELKASLYYEKLILENYFVARTLPADNFFTSPDAQSNFSSEIITGVYNLLIKQAIGIFSKDNLSFEQRNEVEAIVALCNPSYINQLKERVNTLDGRYKKNALNIIKEIEKGR